MHADTGAFLLQELTKILSLIILHKKMIKFHVVSKQDSIDKHVQTS